MKKRRKKWDVDIENEKKENGEEIKRGMREWTKETNAYREIENKGIDKGRERWKER